MFNAILEHPDRKDFDLSSLRAVFVGATTVPAVLVNRLREDLGVAVFTGYGLTEATSMVSTTRPDDPPEIVARTVGRAVPDIELQVVDDSGRPVPAGETGELLVRGYNITPGYFADPDASAAAVDPDGWLHTGDIAALDGEGFLTIADRKKDIFICGGFNVSPAEVENRLLEHPGVAEAAVVGVPDQRLGEVGAATVVPRAGMALAIDELIEWCREQMADYKAPRLIMLAEGLPRNASGKVRKDELRLILAEQANELIPRRLDSARLELTGRDPDRRSHHR